MTKPENPAEWMQQFLELWQEQCSQMTQDPSSLQAMQQAWMEMQKNYWNSFYANANPADTAFAKPGPNDAGLQLAQLADRLATLEERVGTLEAALKDKGKKPGGTKA